MERILALSNAKFCSFSPLRETEKAVCPQAYSEGIPLMKAPGEMRNMGSGGQGAAHLSADGFQLGVLSSAVAALLG